MAYDDGSIWQQGRALLLSCSHSPPLAIEPSPLSTTPPSARTCACPCALRRWLKLYTLGCGYGSTSSSSAATRLVRRLFGGGGSGGSSNDDDSKCDDASAWTPFAAAGVAPSGPSRISGSFLRRPLLQSQHLSDGSLQHCTDNSAGTTHSPVVRARSSLPYRSLRAPQSYNPLESVVPSANTLAERETPLLFLVCLSQR